MELQSLIDEYGELKSKANKLYSEYKDLVVVVEEKRYELQKMLEATGLRSVKSANYGVSTVSKRNIAVTNEHLVMEWLKDTPDIEGDLYIGVKLTQFKQLADQVLKQTGEIIPGTEVSTKETISIKKVSNEKK